MSDWWSRSMLNFGFLEKGLELVSPPHFVYDFLRKYYSFYAVLTDEVLFSDCLYFLRYVPVMPSVIWHIISEVLIFCHLFHEAWAITVKNEKRRGCRLITSLLLAKQWI